MIELPVSVENPLTPAKASEVLVLPGRNAQPRHDLECAGKRLPRFDVNGETARSLARDHRAAVHPDIDESPFEPFGLPAGGAVGLTGPEACC